MKGKCRACGSYAINEHLHGRIKGEYSDLCDVCYWRQKFRDLLKEKDGIIRRRRING